MTFEQMAVQARERYANAVAAARRPDATREEIVDALDLTACRRLVRRSLELAQMGQLSRAEHRAAVAAFSDELDRQMRGDLAALLD